MVPTNADVLFGAVGAANGVNLLGGSQIQVDQGGTYLIHYSLTTETASDNQAALFLNGVASIPGSAYSSGDTQNAGQAIVALQAGDVISLRNVGSTSMVLDGMVGSSANVSASLSIARIAD